MKQNDVQIGHEYLTKVNGTLCHDMGDIFEDYTGPDNHGFAPDGIGEDGGHSYVEHESYYWHDRPIVMRQTYKVRRPIIIDADASGFASDLQAARANWKAYVESLTCKSTLEPGEDGSCADRAFYAGMYMWFDNPCAETTDETTCEKFIASQQFHYPWDGLSATQVNEAHRAIVHHCPSGWWNESAKTLAAIVCQPLSNE